MKVQTLLLLFGLTLNSYAQSQGSQGSSGSPSPTQSGPVVITPYSVTERGPHHHIWQRVTAQTDSAGKTIYQTNSYREMATGMCYWNGNQWADSSDQIQLTANGASATSTQDQVTFAANINTTGAINLTTPDAHQMASHVLGLAYIDASSGNNVLFAETQDSIGQLLPSGNQVIYTNAFTDANCDVLYTHKLAGFEQDIIIRKQLPSPASYGLDGNNIWLQVWTEFTAAPAPQVTQQESGDTFLDFGAMKMGPGKAFMLGSTSNSVPVVKRWVTSQGRTFLVESVQFSAIAAKMTQLPALSGSSGGSNSNSGVGDQAKIHTSHPMLASLAPPSPNFKSLKLPSPKVPRKSSATMHLAGANMNSKGLVLDYSTINGSLTDFTFQSDTTYYVTGEVDLSGTTTIEGGTVIKYSATGTETLVPADLVWKTGMYRPAVFTGKDDDSVGQQISGSSGDPTSTYYGFIALNLGYGASLVSNARFSFLNAAVAVGNGTMRDIQFNQCQTVMAGDSQGFDGGSSFSFYNVLAWNIGTLIGWEGDYGGQSATCENCTIDGCGQFFVDYTSIVTLDNCICAGVGTWNAYQTYNNNSVILGSDSGVFQSVGAGNFYLAPGTYQNQGTSAIDGTLLADLNQKTTYPPLVFAQSYYSVTSTFYPIVQRDTNSNPDLGYHYDPIDFAFGAIAVTNATLTVLPGTVIAGFNTNGIGFGLAICTGSQLLCQGVPTNLCRIVSYSTVQEQSVSGWSSASLSLVDTDTLGYSPASVIDCRFTDFSSLAQDCTHVYGYSAGNSQVPNLQDCQFHGGMLFSQIGVNMTNCLLERVSSEFSTGGGSSGNLRNCLFWQGSLGLKISHVDFSGVIQDNMFDLTQISDSGGYTYGYNGFNAQSVSNYLSLTNANDVFMSSMTYQASWLGNYYQTNTSPLINKGSTTADLLGLYQYTTQTNQVKETNSTVDIGYHYVALNGSGAPDDASGGGIPDYVKDSNGDGIYDAGDLGNWLTNSTCGGGTSDYVKYLQGINLNVCTSYPDTNGILFLQVYTPLK